MAADGFYVLAASAELLSPSRIERIQMNRHSDVVCEDDLEEVGWKHPTPITAELASTWVNKGRRLSLPLLELAGPLADPATVIPRVVEKESGRLYGNFMLAWLDSSGDPRVVNHLPDATLFLQLLDLAYGPVFELRPELRSLLSGMSRAEMALTNDVLQIQLGTVQGNYSMIRHHALMLFYAALWLDEPERSGWLDLYDQLVTHVDERPEGRPSLEQIGLTESGAFEDFAALSGRTLTDPEARQLLNDPDALQRIIDYQLYAAVAIGLLWREYRALPEELRDAWHREQLSKGYVSPDFLEDNWLNEK
ncbi:hypothetical protein [Arthrobacter sp. MMS18-M83]|uniref:hypothetical protein n=1 Tax=Arthrobacter sp. MMS18-M83 TaxID=2996261 RepID=UPI00227CCE40|nr:hypothetical protein [Arthrobacter sp. MMS18-M83]WAH97488.1 hypothetical protein OW521_00845 [Arthrobacter sp. MMS18-M83]